MISDRIKWVAKEEHVYNDFTNQVEKIQFCPPFKSSISMIKVCVYQIGNMGVQKEMMVVNNVLEYRYFVN